MSSNTGPAPIGDAPKGAAPVSITIVAGGLTVFRLDESGGMLAPPDAATRAAVAAALTQAAAQLAALPAPALFAELAARLILGLGAIGTDEAAAAMDLVAESADAATKAVLAADALLTRHAIAEADQHIAQAEHSLGATEH